MNVWEVCKKYGKFAIMWLLFGSLIGILGGVLGALFHSSVDVVTEARERYDWLIYLLPIGGLLIVGMYHRFRAQGNIDTKRVFQAVTDHKNVPLVMLPLIFAGTVITHLLGGSAGREGAALQLGGSLGYNLGQALRQKDDRKRLMVTAGMSSVFSALFGTPLTAAVFSLEVTRRGKLCYQGIFPGFVASVVAFFVAQLFGVEPVRFVMPAISGISFDLIWKTTMIAVLCAGVCILFAISLHKCEWVMKKYLPNGYLRAVIGGFLLVLLTVILGTRDYNGAGMDVITRAISGEVRYEAFLWKIIFTAVTVAAGFKGGEIVPTFFIGATFGCLIGGRLGLPPGFGAVLGFVALFSGMTKCPAASFLLAAEVFGADGGLFFAIVIVLTTLLSGRFGLYGNTVAAK